MRDIKTIRSDLKHAIMKRDCIAKGQEGIRDKSEQEYTEEMQMLQSDWEMLSYWWEEHNKAVGVLIDELQQAFKTEKESKVWDPQI